MGTATTKTKGKTSAILESMKSGNETAPVASEAAPAAPAFDWSSLEAPTVAVYTRNAPAKDLEKDTPEAIKSRVISGFTATATAGKPVWFVQNCGTPERAAEFLKLARRYATFKEMTLRGKADEKSAELRFTVKPREVRKQGKSA